MSQRGLLDRQERPDFVPAGTDDPDRPRYDEEQEVARPGEGHAGRHHQDRADDQHPPPSQPVGAGRQVQRHGGVADQRERQQQAGLRCAQAGARQIDHQDYGERPVREQAHGARDEQQPAVARASVVHCAEEFGSVPGADACRFVGRDVARVHRAERRLDAQPARTGMQREADQG